MCADNYLIEVADLSEGRGSNPSALGLYLYDDVSQFETRQLPEHRSEKAVDSVYSIVINMHNFHAGTSYFSVRCLGGARRFRMVVYEVEMHVQLNEEYHGEVQSVCSMFTPSPLSRSAATTHHRLREPSPTPHLPFSGLSW